MKTQLKEMISNANMTTIHDMGNLIGEALGKSGSEELNKLFEIYRQRIYNMWAHDDRVSWELAKANEEINKLEKQIKDLKTKQGN